MTNISQIKVDSDWGQEAARINQNFQNMNTDLEKVKSATTKFRGYFTSETGLKQKYPSPKVGDTAWVGEPYPGKVYDVVTDGTWHNTDKAPDTGSVELQDYAKKAELTELEDLNRIYVKSGGGSETLTTLSNRLIKEIYLKKLPSDIGAEKQFFLRQITHNYEGIGNRIWVSYKDNTGRINITLPVVSLGEAIEQGYVSNEYFDALLDFTVIPEELGTQPLVNQGEYYPFTNLMLLKKVYTGKPESNSVDTSALADNAVKQNKIQDGSVSNTKLADNAVTNTKLANNAVTNEKVVDNTLSLKKLSYEENSFLYPFVKYNGGSTTLTLLANQIIKKIIVKKFPTDIGEEKKIYVRAITHNYDYDGIGNSIWFSYKDNTGQINISIPRLDLGSEVYGILSNEFIEVWLDFSQTNLEGQILFDSGELYPLTNLPFLYNNENSNSNLYSNYELYSVGNSLASSGEWQKKVVELLGINFNQSLNNNSSHPTSIGGTKSEMGDLNSTYFRTLNLIKYGNIQGNGENAIVLFENANDGGFTFDQAAKSYTLGDFLIMDEITKETLTAIPENERNFNKVIKLKKTAAGKILKITSLPTKEGDVRIKVGLSTTGGLNYGIHVIPQATDDETREYIINKIVENDYRSIYDNKYNDNSVSFTSGTSTSIILEFYDDNNTGMLCSIEDNSSVQYEECRWFDSLDISNWTNPERWNIPSLSSGWKSSIEELLRRFPKLRIGVINVPNFRLSQSDFLQANGVYNEKAFFDAIDTEKQKTTKRCSDICNFYGLKLIDIWGQTNISASNLSEFYYDNNPHPKPEGYNRYGEIVAAKIKEWIIVE